MAGFVREGFYLRRAIGIDMQAVVTVCNVQVGLLYAPAIFHLVTDFQIALFQTYADQTNPLVAVDIQRNAERVVALSFVALFA